MRSFLKKAVLLMLALGLLTALVFVAFPGLKYELYRQLPPKIRWNISFALTDKFVVGMVYFVERNNQLLLVRHTYQDKWALPGGWVERHESFEESARRELREELDIKIDDFEVLEVNKVPRSGIINIAIRGRLKDKQVTIRDGEIYGYRFFELHNLPEDVIYTHKPYIKRYLKARRPPRQLPPEEPATPSPPERQTP
ncbi:MULTISPECIES: NUDIX hydrolase [Microbulbifer]|uniref:NUDIX domain-containing protein n=1 Tax=Microbulbifer salipaludis TaxID=187980 RepID=A0ABS3E3W1_9GAMM|nr:MULTISPECIES: NUDIX domain-containing protein [Microbulbifer]MBN8429993.1 NUDIX domain-containing protein [Microbulbifer salipaludis]